MEIDAALDRFLEGARNGDPSLMAEALAEEIALGVSGGALGSISNEAVVQHLEQSVKEFVEGEGLAVAAQSGRGLQLDFVDRRTRGRRTGRTTEGWVEGTLLVQETALPVEVGLTKTGHGWKIDGFRLLLTPGGSLAGEWSGEWWAIPRRDGEGELRVTLHQDSGGNLSGEVELRDNDCLDHASISEGYAGTSPTRWATWTAAVERGLARFFTMDIHDAGMTGTLSFDFYDCHPTGRFRLELEH